MKKILYLILAVMMLMNFSILSTKVRAVTFPDVEDSHWALEYIEKMKDSGIINGYEDGTFRPEAKVKTGEFIKMVISCKWKVDTTQNLPEGAHWATPYAKVGNNIILYEPYYTYEKYETNITREEAVRLIWKMYSLLNPGTKIDRTEQYIKGYTDENTIEDEDNRRYFNACIQHGLINGFEDGTLRPNETLTRAQATKLLCTMLDK